MNTATQKIPVGYKQTDVGVIPADWDVKRIGDVADVIGGGTPSTRISEYWNGDINWFTPTEIGNEKYVSQSKRKITTTGLQNSGAKILEVGAILMTSRAGIGDLAILREKAATNQGFQSLSPRDPVISEFIYYLMSTKKGDLLEKASGSTFLEISPSNVRNILIQTPSLIEQTAITTALSDADALIGKLEKLIGKKRNIKQGTMQELLTGKVRLPGFGGKWETKKLGEVAEFDHGRDLPKSDLSEDGPYKCIHYGQLFSEYKELISEIKSGTHSYTARFYSKINDVLMPTSDVTPRGLATASCIKEDGVILGGGILVIRLHPDYDGLYLSYTVSQNKNSVLRFVKGSTVFHLYANDIANFEISFPELKEQVAIASVLSDMDTEIEKLESQLAKYQNLKQGMMQTLLTGKIRLLTK